MVPRAQPARASRRAAVPCAVRAGVLVAAAAALVLLTPHRADAAGAPLRRAAVDGAPAPPAALAGQPAHVRVFAANILYCDPLHREPPERYRERRERLVELLARVRPDVVVIQEASECPLYDPPEHTVLSLAAGLAAEGLAYEQRFWVSEAVSGVWREGLAFLWDPQRVSPAPEGLSCAHLTATYTLGPLRVTKSVCRLALRPTLPVADCPAGVEPFTLVNTHLDARRAPVRDAQAVEAAALLAQALAPDAPALLCGDLNGADMERFFAAGGWRCVRRSGVDYLLARGLDGGDVLGHRVVPLVQPGISDHDGLAADVRWRCRATDGPAAAAERPHRALPGGPPP